METSPSELKALVSLLDDPDDRVYGQVREKLLGLGSNVAPVLEKAWEYLQESPKDDLARNRIEDILHRIHIARVKMRLRTWVVGGGADLLEGALIICRYRYPELDEQKVRKQIDRIQSDIRPYLNIHKSPEEKVRAMNHILFLSRGFRGDKKKYYLPKNFYLSEVLDRKMGSPIALGVLYQVLAESLQIPIRGVNLPEHFLVAYTKAEEGNPMAVHFYVNPFRSGEVSFRKQIYEYLQKLDIPPKERFFMPCGNIEIIKRTVLSLIVSYQKQDDFDRVEELQSLLELFGQ